MSLPLSDVKVVDYCQFLAGPNASMLMADQGADVIRIEPPGREPASDAAPNMGYLAFNRNKRSIVVDVNKPKGREILLRLVDWADVFITNMRISSRSRRSISFEDLAAINPRLVYASLTAYGEAGPEADLPGVDIAIQARVGDIDSRHPPGEAAPSHMYLFHFDMAASILICYGVMVALHDREHTGKGQKVEVNLLESALALQAIQMVRVSGREDSSSARPPAARELVMLCGDGRYLFVRGLAQRWGEFCRSLGMEQLTSDPRFDTLAKREQSIEELKKILSEPFLTKPAAAWEAVLKADGHTASVVRKISEVYDDPQVVANEMITRFEQAGVGTVTAVNAPFRLPAFAGEPRVRRQVPRVGEHTREVLRELGYTLEAIEGLKAEGIIN